jgi:photosystem II stability/assembly factor-like uncharacterized protein
LIGLLLCLTQTVLAACRPEPGLEALEVPPETLTAIALRDQPEATATTRPPTGTPSPVASPTPVPSLVPTITPSPAGPPTATPGPAQLPEGDTLAYMRAGLTFSLIELDMVDPLNGWALASNRSDPADHVMRTTDGGLTWEEVTPPQPVLDRIGPDQRAWLAASSPEIAWVTFAGRDGQPLSETWIWRTTDGGQTWQPSAPILVEDTDTFAPISLGSNDSLSWFTLNLSVDPDSPVYRLFLSQDGYLWQAIVNPISAWSLEKEGASGCRITDLMFANDGTGYATGECPAGTATAARSSDAGRTWAPLEVPDLSGVYGADAEGRRCQAVSILYASEDRLVAPIRCQGGPAVINQDALVTWVGELSVSPVTLPGLLAGGTFFDDARGLVLVARNSNRQGEVFSPFTFYQTADGAQTLTELRTVQWRGPLQSFPDSWVFVLARGDRSENRVLVTSGDGGRTWALPDAGLVVGAE